MLIFLHFLKYHTIVISFKNSFNLISKSDSEQKRIGTCDILKLPQLQYSGQWDLIL